MKATYEALVREYDTINKPYGVNVSVGAAPSTNINSGTSSRTVDIGGLPFVLDDNAREKKGINLSATATAFYSWRLGEATDLVAKGSVNVTKNIEDSEQDSLSFVLSPEVQTSFDRARFGIGPVLEYQLSGYDPYAFRYGIAAFAQVDLDATKRSTTQAKLLKQDYISEDFRDGYTFGLRNETEFKLSADTTATLISGFEREMTRRDFLDSNAFTVGAELSRHWDALGGIATTLGFEYRHQSFLGDYPLIAAPREDNRIKASVFISYDQFAFLGNKPSIGYEYVVNRSNVDMKEYVAHNFLIGVRKSF